VTIRTESIQQYIGQTLYDDGGNKIGKIGAIFLDDETGQPEWVTVSTGFFGTNESFVPVADATGRDDGLTVPFSKDKVKGAPNVDVDQGHLSSDEEENLYRYYDLQYSDSASGTGLPGTVGSPGSAGTTGESNVGRTDLVQRDEDFDDDDSTGMSAGPMNRRGTPIDDSSDVGDDAMTRSEERVNVGTETVATGRARLRKWVETEHEQVEVPVRKEKVRLESEPITDENRGEAYSGADITEDQHEVTVHEERPVVQTEAVPVERVRLAKDQEQETQTVGAQVRKERVDLDADQDVDRR